MPTGFTFTRKAREETADRPCTLSVICLNKNHASYIEDNLLSVAAQKFEDFEYVVADGGSTDGSLELFKRFEFVSVLPGSDRSRDEGILRAAAAATGRYVMFTTSTDGYVSRDWFRRATEALDRDPEASLVWAAAATMSADGTLGRIVYPRNFGKVPQKREWFFRWIDDRRLSRSYLPELNYCVHKSVFRRCLQATNEFPELDSIDPILRFLFRFNREGYLPLYLPVLASYGRTHEHSSQSSPHIQKSEERYQLARKRYRQELRRREKVHVYRNSQGAVIAETKSPKLGCTRMMTWRVLGRDLFGRLSRR